MVPDTEGQSSLSDLVVCMARAVVADPAGVTVEEVVAQQVLVLNLMVAKTDMGRVIGKKGRVANAMRMVLLAAAKGEQRVSLEIRPAQEQSLT